MSNIFKDVTLSTANYDAILIGWNNLTLQTGVTFNGGNSTYSRGAATARANLLNSSGNNWTITDGGEMLPFVTTWLTTVANESITIPTSIDGEIYDYTVDWGDGTIESSQTTDATHTYATTGTQTISITGVFPRIYFNDAGDKDKIQTIEQWGAIEWTSMQRAFYGCSNLNITNVNIDTPNLSGVTSLISMFNGAISFNHNLSGWDVSLVTSTSSMFNGATAFNGDLSLWDTSKVTDMGNMFNYATNFNGDLSSWNLSAVTDITDMFLGSNLSSDNYDKILIGWAINFNTPDNLTLKNIPAKYCLANASRIYLKDNKGWTIGDDGVACKIWRGTTNTEWATNTNWSNDVLPIASDDIVISNVTNQPIIGTNTAAVINNLTIDARANLILTNGGSLTVGGNLTNNGSGAVAIDADATTSSSLIVNGTATGNITYNRYVTGVNKWHLISSPVVGETIADVYTNGLLATNGTNVGFATYNNTTGSISNWVYTQTTNTAITINSGVGYSALRTEDGTLPFTGTLKTEDTSVDISTANVATTDENIWNLIGNPYPSFIAINATANGMHNFMDTNASAMNPNFAGLYVWNPETSSYDILNSIENDDNKGNFLAPGQGFFVPAKTDAISSIVITEAMQSHQPEDLFYKTNNNTPAINLSLSNDTKTKTTQIKYIENKTTGLDVGYDAGVFGGTATNFNVFTHLVTESEGVDFQLQVLPTNTYEDMIVPIGLKSDMGTLSLSLSTENLPTNIKVYIEDITTGIFTRLDEFGSSLEIDLFESVNGIGRFYLHTTTADKSVLGNVKNGLETVSVYNSNHTLFIYGLKGEQATVKLFNLIGQQQYEKTFNSGNVNQILLPQTLAKGVYIVELDTSDDRKINKKIIID
jgi:surface protein